MPMHDFGFVPRHGRLFGKGDFKYVVLDLLREQPSHGYEIIRRLEERFQGHYVPSAGVVYPTLQMLEDLGYVTASQQEGKKVYTITAQGLGFLEEQRPAVEETRHRMHAWGREAREEIGGTMHELRDLGHLLRHEGRTLDAPKLGRIRQVIARACREIEAIVEEREKPKSEEESPWS
jgi:DNA-binding PadR family transcriptional regulator